MVCNEESRWLSVNSATNIKLFRVSSKQRDGGGSSGLPPKNGKCPKGIILRGIRGVNKYFKNFLQAETFLYPVDRIKKFPSEKLHILHGFLPADMKFHIGPVRLASDMTVCRSRLIYRLFQLEFLYYPCRAEVEEFPDLLRDEGVAELFAVSPAGCSAVCVDINAERTGHTDGV